jgi:hypothetical protein
MSLGARDRSGRPTARGIGRTLAGCPGGGPCPRLTEGLEPPRGACPAALIRIRTLIEDVARLEQRSLGLVEPPQCGETCPQFDERVADVPVTGPETVTTNGKRLAEQRLGAREIPLRHTGGAEARPRERAVGMPG